MKTYLLLVALLISWNLPEKAFAIYDPSIGRWLSPDPIGEPHMLIIQNSEINPRNLGMGEMITGPNRFTYVGNNPINYTDPYGLDAKTVLLPFGYSFSYHVPGTDYFPGEDVHEAQHRKDWANKDTRFLPGWQLEQRAFAAQAKYLQQRIKEMEGKCSTDAEKKQLANYKDALSDAEAIANSDQAAKYYWNMEKSWWQKKAE